MVEGKINPEKLALEHNETTHLVINKILYNQKVSITENKLKDLLKIKGIELDLPITKDTYETFISPARVGKSSYRGFVGVYVFTHKASKSIYVGSSNLLRRRMDYYFKGVLLSAGPPQRCAAQRGGEENFFLLLPGGAAGV